MLDISYQKLHDICVAFHTLGVQEFKCFEELYSVSAFYGGFTDMAEAVDLQVSNVRKALKKMEQRGIVCICYAPDGKQRVDKIFLLDGWQDELVRTAKKYTHSFEYCKKPRDKNKFKEAS